MARELEFPIVAIGAGVGGLEAVRRIAEALPRKCDAAVVVVFHPGGQVDDVPDILSWHGKLPVVFGEGGTPLEPGRLYVAPSDHHMLLSREGIQLDRGAKIHGTRPAVDPLFLSAARAFGSRVVGVVLSGMGRDGAAGLRAIQNTGGLALVQDPVEAAVSEMPAAAFAHADPEVLATEQLARRVVGFCAGMKALKEALKR